MSPDRSVWRRVCRAGSAIAGARKRRRAAGGSGRRQEHRVHAARVARIQGRCARRPETVFSRGRGWSGGMADGRSEGIGGREGVRNWQPGGVEPLADGRGVDCSLARRGRRTQEARSP
eukprot:5234210-Pleurochrysis_carterae.AAC.1